MHKLEHG
jgi:hypothetical protein